MKTSNIDFSDLVFNRNVECKKTRKAHKEFRKNRKNKHNTFRIDTSHKLVSHMEDYFYE